MSTVLRLTHATLKLKDGSNCPVNLPLDRMTMFIRSDVGDFTNIQLNTVTEKVLPVLETEAEIISQISGKGESKNGISRRKQR